MLDVGILLLLLVGCSVGIGFFSGRASARGDLKDAEQRIEELLGEQK